MADIPKELFARIRRIQITTRRKVEDMLSGAYRSIFKGQGIEFEDVRRYSPGDDVRAIDWKVTARTHFPHVRTFREERELTVMLLVDVSASGKFGSGSRAKSDWIAEIGALLAFSAITNNDKVGLLLFSDRVEKYLPPKKGTRHVLRVIRELLVADVEGRKTDLGMALAFLQNVQRRRGVCFLITDLIVPPCRHELMLAAQHYDLITIGVRDPHEHAYPKIGLIEMRDLETGERRMVDTGDPAVQEHLRQTAEERHRAHAELMRRIDAGYIPIWTNQPYLEPILSYFRQREHRALSR